MRRALLPSAFLVAVFLAIPVAFAEEGAHAAGHGGVPWSFVIWHAVNLVVLGGILIFLLRKPARDALRNRAVMVRRAIDEANKARDDANARVVELESKLSHFRDELDRMYSEVRAAAERERQLILEQAEREAEAVRGSAERAIRDETARARRSLQEEAVNLAIRAAEGILVRQARPEDQERLSGDLIRTIQEEKLEGQGGQHGA
jgi:F-type H+-transporting ATPase subunit b